MIIETAYKPHKIVIRCFVTSETKTPLKADKYDTFKGVTSVGVTGFERVTRALKR